jgi:mono/diheme cytochrome c family protein
MRKILKVLGYLAAGLAALLAVAAVAIYIGSNAKLRKTYAIKVQPVGVPPLTDAAALARGRHIAATRGCLECHGPDLGGNRVFENGAMGKVHGPNLTRGEGGVPAGWTDLDYVRAIRHGVNREGRGLFLMPSTDYATFSDADMGALIAYINSVPPVNRPRGPVALGPVARALTAAGRIKLAAAEIDHAHVRPAVVEPGVSVDYGRYVAATCTGCHGPNFSGGKIAVGPPDWPPAANLTPHAEGRIRQWSEADFLKAIRTARRPDGTEINAVMPRAFAQLEDVELKAIWAYLKTLPAAATGIR